MELTLLIARLVLAGVFIVAGVAKLADRQGSSQAMEDFGVPVRFAALLGSLLPLAEIAIAVALIPLASAWWGALGALLLLLAFIGGIGVNLARGNAPNCHCFGQLHSEPAGWSTITRNGVLALVAIFVIWQGRDDAGASTIGWFGDLSPFERVTTVAGIVLFAAVAALGWLLVQVIQQNGRLLLRLDELDGTSTGDRTTRSRANDALPVGSPAPSFALPDVDGHTVSLHDLLSAGKPVLLLFSSAGCKICGPLLPDIARWQREYADRMTVAVISRGEPAKNRAERDEHGLQRMLVQDNREVIDLFHVTRTPTAILILPDGIIGSDRMATPDDIRELVTHAIASPGRLQPANGRGNGHPQMRDTIGTPLPDLELSTLDGDGVELHSIAGDGSTTLLFWSPTCGFCTRMLDDLKRLEADLPADAPPIFVISTGDAERNRAQRLRSTVLLDTGFRVGRAIGASGTPSAVRVDQNGTVASAVAVGAPAVLSLLGEAAPAGSPGS